uniref:Putative secreted protein n=1 Tax=Anopheles darlingi TaxID=43151 RepID=A0A2M4D6E5_ANODA
MLPLVKLFLVSLLLLLLKGRTHLFVRSLGCSYLFTERDFVQIRALFGRNPKNGLLSGVARSFFVMAPCGSPKRLFSVSCNGVFSRLAP